MRTIRLAFAAVLSLAALLMVNPPATADNCDIFINPADCQNTGWTIGVIAILTGGVAVATAATVTRPRRSGETPIPPTPLPVPRPQVRLLRDRVSGIGGVDVLVTYATPTITIQPQDGAVGARSVRLEIHRDPGSQTVREVHRGR